MALGECTCVIVSILSFPHLIFQLPILDFLETPSVSFSIFLDPFKTLKHGKSFAVTPVALTYKDNTETFYEPLVPMSVSFNVPSKM